MTKAAKFAFSLTPVKNKFKPKIIQEVKENKGDDLLLFIKNYKN